MTEKEPTLREQLMAYRPTAPRRVERHELTVIAGNGYHTYACGCGREFDSRGMWETHVVRLAGVADEMTDYLRRTEASHLQEAVRLDTLASRWRNRLLGLSRYLRMGADIERGIAREINYVLGSIR